MIKGKKQLFSIIMSASIIAPNAINAYAGVSVANEVRTITIMEVVKTNSLNVRAGAGTKYSKIGTLKKGQRIEVISVSNDWAKFNYNGRTGYVSTSYLNKIQDTTPVVKKEMTVKVDDLSVRKGAGTSYTKLGSLNKGDVVVVIQELSNGWVKIEYKGGFGYVSNKNGAYLNKVSTSNPSNPSVPNQPSNPGVNVVKYRANEDLNLRKTASWSGQALIVIKKGTELESISESNGWIKVNYNGTVGYLPTSHVTKVESSSTPSQPSTPEVDKKQMVVKVNDLSVRKGAGTKYAKLGALNKGDKVTILEELSNGWVKIVFNNGYGYISNVKGAYLEEVVETNQEKANKVIALIDVLNDDITVDDENAINEAKKAYEILNQEAKDLVTNLDKLTNAETQMKSIIDKINNVLNLISDLPIEIKIEHRQEVMNAKIAFDNLSPEEQKKIAFTDKAILESAIAKISSLDKIEADNQIVAELINRINLLKDAEINIDDHEKEIKDIRAKYDDLEYVRQDEVTNYEDFRLIELDLTHIYEAVIYLEGLIISLPEQIEREHIAIVEEAKKRYEDLGDKNQSKVNPEYKLKLDIAIEQAEVLK